MIARDDLYACFSSMIELLGATEQITILSTMISSVVHPMIHSFNERVYNRKDQPELQQYPELFFHGQYLNEEAIYFFSIPISFVLFSSVQRNVPCSTMTRFVFSTRVRARGERK
jgi:hypothetical protein